MSNNIIINAQYIKDLSFENPKTLCNVSRNETPQINVSVGVNASSIQDRTYETLLKIQVKSTIRNEVQYLIDLKYAGIFTLEEHFDDKAKILFVQCPNIIFPYARRIISDLTQDGGYFPICIAPIDFLTLYTQNNIKTNIVW